MARDTSRFLPTPKLNLHDYQNFHDNSSKKTMTINQLNQIIRLNGYIKIHKCRIKSVLKATTKIEAMKPQRSTLHEAISPHDSSLTLEQVKEDLDALEWHDSSPFQSLGTLNSEHHHQHHQTVINSGEDAFKISPVTKPRSKRGRPRKRKLDEIGNNGRYDVSAVDGAVPGKVTAVDNFSDLLPQWCPC